MATAKSKAEEKKVASIVKHPGGRPREYESPKTFAAKVEEYFVQAPIPSISGLSYFLGFCDKQSFSEYEKYGGEFSLTVKRARLRIEGDREDRLNDKAKFTPGTIFDLKNNYGWKDKQEVELTGNFASILAERRKRAK